MRSQRERRGVLLVNVGSPERPDAAALRRYLRDFLMDPRVLDMPAAQRWILVNAVIVPFRAPKSAHAYRAVWDHAGPGTGAPLLAYTRTLASALETRLGDPVAVGMRCGAPSIADGIAALGAVDRIIVVPLFPQYASATTGSALEELYRVLGGLPWVPPVSVVGPFYADPAFLDAQVASARSYIADADHVLFSYHGLPTGQIRAAPPAGAPSCQLGACCVPAPPWCYRAQCLATSAALAARLDLAPSGCSTAFQSRLGRAEWLSPATDATVVALARAGVRRLTVLCPSFVADNLETIEEIGLRARDSFVAAGGVALTVVPCLNADPAWVEALARWVEAPSGSTVQPLG